MLQLYGYETVKPTWKVTETESTFFMRFYVIESGEVEYSFDGNITKLKKGKAYCFPTNTPYSISHNIENPLKCLYVHIDLTPLILDRLIEIDIENDIVLNHLCESMKHISITEKYERNGMLQTGLTQCIVTVLKSKGLFSSIDKRLVESIEFMVSDLSENITISDIAKNCGYHPKYYNKLFTDSMGVTPYQFFLQLKMKKALSLLKEGNSVLNTAVQIGYADEKSFCRIFKKMYGISPLKAKSSYFI